MTNDLLNSFKNYFLDDKVVLDNYSLEKGIYFKFNNDDTYERLDILNEKKGKETSDLYEYFCVRDYYSKYLDSNKAVDTTLKESTDNEEYTMNKKICSNNHLTLFFKNKFVLGISQDEKESVSISFFEKGISKYYESLSILGENKKEEKIILENIKDDIVASDEIISKKELMVKYFRKVIQVLKEEKEKLPKDIWIKIFIDSTKEEYERASNKYLSLKIFNKNERNVNVDKVTYGTNNYNYSLNSNKKFLELKSTSYKAGSFVSIEDIKCIRNMYTWLLKNVANKGYIKIPIDFKFNINLSNEQEILSKPIYIIKATNDNGVAIIDDFDYVPMYSNKIRKFNCQNYINEELDIKDINIDTNKLNELEAYISQIWFSKYLIASYDKDNKSIEMSKLLPIWKKEMLYKYNNIFFNMFYKLDYKPFIQKIDEIAIKIIINTFKDEFVNKKTFESVKALDLWIALDKYIERKEMSLEMDLKEIKEKSEEIIVNKKEVSQIEDKLYYYITGQAVRYLFTKSKAAKLTQDVFAPIIDANTTDKLKLEVYYLREKYAHELLVSGTRFNSVFELILLNEPKTSIKEKENKFSLLAGILADNLFFKVSLKDETSCMEE